jgi:hypothetical protein
VLRKGHKVHHAKHRFVHQRDSRIPEDWNDIHQVVGTIRETHSPLLITARLEMLTPECSCSAWYRDLRRCSFSRCYPPLLFLCRTLVSKQCDLACYPFWDATVFPASVWHNRLESLHQILYTVDQVLAAVGRRSGRYIPQAHPLTSFKMEQIQNKPRQLFQLRRRYVISRLFGRLTTPPQFTARVAQPYMSRMRSLWPARAVEHQTSVQCQAQ